MAWEWEDSAAVHSLAVPTFGCVEGRSPPLAWLVFAGQLALSAGNGQMDCRNFDRQRVRRVQSGTKIVRRLRTLPLERGVYNASLASLTF